MAELHKCITAALLTQLLHQDGHFMGKINLLAHSA